LQPLAALIAEELTDKTGAPVTLDVLRPLQAFDAGGRARAAGAIVHALIEATEAGLDPAAMSRAPSAASIGIESFGVFGGPRRMTRRAMA